jgi:integrase
VAPIRWPCAPASARKASLACKPRRRLDPHPDRVRRSTPLPTSSGPSAAAATRTAPGEGATPAAGVLVFESLKKRRTGIFRSVPVPPALLDTIDMVHGIRELHARRGKGRGVRLWPWSRMTGWRGVHAVMQAAGLEGVPASPKGLRHGFGVAAVTAGIPLNLVQKWLGHAQLSTTAVYANAVGAEEKDIARRMWN